MLIFAEPVLTAAELPQLDPEHDPAVNGSNAIAYAPLGDVAAFINATASSTTKQVLYFRAGVYSMGPTYSATLRGSLRWVHLAPGAYVKGAFTFWSSSGGGSASSNSNSSSKGSSTATAASSTEYKLTGFGVLSGEQYV